MNWEVPGAPTSRDLDYIYYIILVTCAHFGGDTPLSHPIHIDPKESPIAALVFQGMKWTNVACLLLQAWREFTGSVMPTSSTCNVLKIMPFLPPMTGNGKFIPPIKMVIFLGIVYDIVLPTWHFIGYCWVYFTCRFHRFSRYCFGSGSSHFGQHCDSFFLCQFEVALFRTNHTCLHVNK